MNNGFLDELDDVQQQGHYYNDRLDEFSEELAHEEQANIVLSEAVKRIEQAKLYETLLKHSLFGPNSARPEIISMVESEIKDFILSRLEILLGIKSAAVTQASSSPFTQEEVDALKAIANKLMAKDRPVPNTQPTLNQVKQSAYSQPELKQNISVNQVTSHQRQNDDTVRQVQQKRHRQKNKSQNTSSITGLDYAQAVNPSKPPAPMPSQAQIDQLNAQQAAMNSGSSAMGLGGQSSPLSKLIGMAAQQMMHVNKDVKEEQ